MSENNGIQESYGPTGQYDTDVDYDGTQAAYASNDDSSNIESALSEKAEVDELKEKVEELEDSEKVESEVEEVSKPKDDEFGSKFAALSRREKAIRQRESALEEKLAAMEARLETLNAPKEEAPKAPEIPIEMRLKKDPLGTLAELGLSFDTLTNLALNDGKLTTEMQMDLMKQEMDQKYSTELQQLRQELVEKEKRLEEEKYNDVVQNFKSELTQFINTDNKYELIRANDAVETVFEVIEKHYQETGRVMSKDEAADQVESYLEEEIDKLLKLEKLKKKIGSQAQQPQEAKQVKQPAPTLLNAHSTSASKPSRNLSRDESMFAAASLLKWNE
jgi:hypothetical protein